MGGWAANRPKPRLRGLEKVKLEWTLICAAYNLKRLHRLGAGLKLAVVG